MRCFPVCMDIEGKKVVLAGEDAAAGNKLEKLRPYGADICRVKDASQLTEDMLSPPPALVIVAEGCTEDKRRISAMCRERNIPVNVADEPEWCSFYFPALITRGSCTVAVTTSGESPAVAAQLRRRLERQLPEKLEEILVWAGGLRGKLPRAALASAVAQALEIGRPLTENEIMQISAGENAGADENTKGGN